MINADDKQIANIGRTRRKRTDDEYSRVLGVEEPDDRKEEDKTSSFFSMMDTASDSMGVKKDETESSEVLSRAEFADPNTGSQYMPHTMSRRERIFSIIFLELCLISVVYSNHYRGSLDDSICIFTDLKVKLFDSIHGDS